MKQNEILIAKKSQDRLDLYLRDALLITRSKAQQIIKDGNVLIDGILAKTNSQIKEGMEITILHPQDKELTTFDLDIPIRYQNNDLLVVSKPANLVVHPSAGHQDDTLVNALIAKYPLSESAFRPGIVHRIDKDTTGLLIIAKNDQAHLHLSEQIKSKIAVRKYLALVLGTPQNDFFQIRGRIGRSKTNRFKMAINEQGREATTLVKIVERFAKYTLVECQLETGRTHQIRVHLSTLGFPIVGDLAYGGKDQLYNKGQLLHSYYLKFFNPCDGKEIEVIDELPSYFNDILNNLRGKKDE